MGLLGDSLTDPQTLAVLQLAGGLLSPGSFGQGLSRGLTGYQSALMNSQDMQLKKAQVLTADQEQQIRAQQLRLMQMKMDEAQRYLSGSTPTTAAPAPMSQSLMFPPEVNAVRATLPQSGGAGSNGGPATSRLAAVTPDQAAGYMQIGLWDKSMFDLWKASKEGMPFQPGYRAMLDGSLVYNGDPNKGVTMGPDGRVQMMDGATETLGKVAESTKSGETRGVNKNTLAPLDRINPATGRPYAMTMDDLVREVGGGSGGVAPAPTGGGATSMSDFPPDLQQRIQASIQRNGDKSYGLQAGNRAPSYFGAQPAGNFNPAIPSTAPLNARFAGFQGPAEAAASRVTAENNANLATKPPLTAADTRARNLQDSDKAYGEDLNKRVDEAFNLKRRNAEILKQIDDYQTGIGGSEMRSRLASNLKNMFPGNTTMQTLAEKINGGSVVSAQTLHNLVAGAMITNAIQVLQGQGRLNKAEVQTFQAASESPETDPGALRRIVEIQNRFADQDYAEQQARAKAIKDRTYNAETWQADYSAMRNGALGTNSQPAPSLKWNAKAGKFERVK